MSQPIKEIRMMFSEPRRVARDYGAAFMDDYRHDMICHSFEGTATDQIVAMKLPWPWVEKQLGKGPASIIAAAARRGLGIDSSGARMPWEVAAFFKSIREELGIDDPVFTLAEEEPGRGSITQEMRMYGRVTMIVITGLSTKFAKAVKA